ncbi:MAG: nucleotidyltransferase domain-containing protein [Rhodocyclaceae bacterium]|nr:nucleotidyltransferase domain-containing protein [Rhodocyclaceae bacterium]
MTTILHDHSLRRPVLSRIEDELRSIERSCHVRILFACESGSRGWGFASPDCDYDVRFIYVHRPDWYLRVRPGRDVIERPVDDALDVSGWELRKALGLLARSNPTLFEWLGSPVVYRQDPGFAERFRTLASQHFSDTRGCWHYLSMARRNFRGCLQGDNVRLKTYLYVLRPLLAAQWIASGRGMPPMRFARLVDELIDDEALRDEIIALLFIKLARAESDLGPRFPRIHDYIETALQQLTPPTWPERSGSSPEALDGLLRDSVLLAESV